MGTQNMSTDKPKADMEALKPQVKSESSSSRQAAGTSTVMSPSAASASAKGASAKKIILDDYEVGQSDIFKPSEMRAFLKVLVEKKDELLAKSKARIERGEIVLDANEMSDEVDLASADVEQGLLLSLLERDRRLVALINRAIEKIATGEYGYCEGTGEEIPKKRLEITPWTRYSVRYQEQQEKLKR
ncbi:MAG: TraR/DksA family transcriptional regulator [Proteobacteria bacterium]|nr:TraR/DksA family transcriptional regulator [Pseudomonadota bacterium]